MDDTRNSTSKMDETTVLENTAVLSRSQQSLPPTKTSSMIRTSYTAIRPSALNGEGRDGTASEVKIGGLLNQISEKEDIQSFIG